jgi:ABC-type multidrug transport system fused ATPase/permease subunit
METEQPSLQRVIKSTWVSIDHRTRRSLVSSGLISAVLAALDAAGVALLPTLIHRFEATGATTGVLAGLSTPALAGLCAALLLVKSVGGAVVVFWQSSFLARDEGQRTIALFRRILFLPYRESSVRDTAGFIRDLHISIPQLYRGAGTGLALLIADVLSMFGLVVVLLVNSPAGGLTLAIFLVVAARVYHLLVRSRLGELSVRLQDDNRDCLNELSESLGGLKALKAFSVENVAVDRFRLARERFALATRDVLFYTQVYRYYLEVALVIGLGLCLGVIWLVEGRTAILASFGLLAGVAARAMPALSRALNSITNIKVTGAAALYLEPDLRELEEAEVEVEVDDGVRSPAHLAPISTHLSSVKAGNDAGRPALIELDRVSFQYPTRTRDTLRDISLELDPGEMVAILGESGAGKTTLVDIVIGLLEPTSGTIRRAPGVSLGYVAQETFAWDDTVLFNVALGRPAVNSDVETEVWNSLEAAQLADWVRSQGDGLHTRLGERGGRISGGQRQRLGVSRAMFGQPSVLLLDEPTSALDSETSRSLMSTLVTIKRKVGIVVVTHDPIVVRFADRTMTLDTDGELAV